MKKKVVFPLGNKYIFDVLADIALAYEPTMPASVKDFKAEVHQELTTEAYLSSLTASGEIGDNPQTPRIAESFYDNFPEIFSPKGGVIGKNMAGSSMISVKKEILSMKSSIVNLIQIFIHTAMGLVTRNKFKLKDTSFEYPKLSGKKTAKDYEVLAQVEKNRYMRLFIATIFTKTIGELMALSPDELRKAIKEFDMWNINNVKDPKEQFSILRKPENRRVFVELVKEMWSIELVNKNKSKKK